MTVGEEEDMTAMIEVSGPGVSPGEIGVGYKKNLKDLTSKELGAVADSLLDAIMDFTNNIVFSGLVPSWMCPVFYGAQLIALSKPDNGVRPIAMGLTFRRLAGKVARAKLRETCQTLFHPN